MWTSLAANRWSFLCPVFPINMGKNMFSQRENSESWVEIYFPLRNMISTCQHYQVLIGYFKISVESKRQEARKFNERAKSLWETQDSSLGWEQEISSLGKAAMESEESIRHSAHRFLQGKRVSPTSGEEERPKYNHGIRLLGRAFLTFPSVPFQIYKNGSDNILLGSCENLKLEM